jgi:hypothetical protein
VSKSVFIIQNQHQQYLDTDDQWSNTDSDQTAFFSPHRDVALNKLFEMTLADPLLRGTVTSCPADERGKPLLDRQSVDVPADGNTEAAAISDSPPDCVADTIAQ